MENFQGFIGSSAHGVLNQGLKPETSVDLVVREPFYINHGAKSLCWTNRLWSKAAQDIGSVVAAIFKVRTSYQYVEYDMNPYN